MKSNIQCSFMRYEKKYLLSKTQYQMLLREIPTFLKPDEYGETTNCSIYYDTDNWDLIRKSIEKPVYKEKLRVRSYGVPRDTDTVFVELKKKYDGVVYKRRTTISAKHSEDYLAGENHLIPDSQIGKEIAWFQNNYHAKPKVYIAYDRRSYAGIEDSQLRITFDQNIRFREYALDLRKGDYGERMLQPGMVLMEIKIPEATPIWLVQILSKIGAKPASFSKYGTYYKEYVMNQKRKEENYSA